MSLTDNEVLRIAAQLARRFGVQSWGADDSGYCFIADGGLIYTDLGGDEDVIESELGKRINITKSEEYQEWRGRTTVEGKYHKALAESLELGHIPERKQFDGITYDLLGGSTARIVSAAVDLESNQIHQSVQFDGETFIVTLIGDSAFANCDQLESVVVPDSISSVGTLAFENCSNLGSISLPDNGIWLSNRAFCRCTSLESIVVPKSVGRIGAHVFDACANLASISIPGLDKKSGKWNSRLSLKSFYPGVCPGWARLVMEYLNEGEVVPISAAFLKSAPPAELLTEMVLHSDARNCDNKLALIRILAGGDQVGALAAIENWGVYTKKNLDEALKAATENKATRASAFLLDCKKRLFGASRELKL